MIFLLVRCLHCVVFKTDFVAGFFKAPQGFCTPSSLIRLLCVWFWGSRLLKQAVCDEVIWGRLPSEMLSKICVFPTGFQ